MAVDISIVHDADRTVRRDARSIKSRNHRVCGTDCHAGIDCHIDRNRGHPVPAKLCEKSSPKIVVGRCGSDNNVYRRNACSDLPGNRHAIPHHDAHLNSCFVARRGLCSDLQGIACRNLYCRASRFVPVGDKNRTLTPRHGSIYGACKTRKDNFVGFNNLSRTDL